MYAPSRFDEVYRDSGMYYGSEPRARFVQALGHLELDGARALDLACGDGRHAAFLARRGCAVDAYDVSPVAIAKLDARARRERLPIRARIVDLEAQALPVRGYDLVVAATTLNHLGQRARERVARQIPGCLDPGGLAYVYVFTTRDPGHRLRWLERRGADTSLVEPHTSETHDLVTFYYPPGALRALYTELELLWATEGFETDRSHGPPHVHGFADVVLRRRA